MIRLKLHISHVKSCFQDEGQAPQNFYFRKRSDTFRTLELFKKLKNPSIFIQFINRNSPKCKGVLPRGSILSNSNISNESDRI